MLPAYEGSRLGRVMIDLNTQWEFLDEKGLLPVRNREAVISQLRRVFELAEWAGMPVISSIETHSMHDTMHGVPLHCVEDSFGHQKPPFATLTPRIIIETTNNFDLPYDLMTRYHQIIFRKKDLDLFSNPKADRLLTELKPGEYIVYGTVLEREVKYMALGLLARHKKVAVIRDACGYWSEADADLCLRQMEAKGVRITTVDELVEMIESIRRRVRMQLASIKGYHPPAEKRKHPGHAPSGTRTRTT